MTARIATSPEPLGRPSWALLGTEPLRAAMEYIGMHLMKRPSVPTGDGHPVVIFPGLATDSAATAPLRNFCAAQGYVAYDWGRGFNTGPRGDMDGWLDELSDHVRWLTASHRESVSLIGWSLGGFYARELAKRMPHRIRTVITIGTPFAGTTEHSNVGWLFDLLNSGAPRIDAALGARLREPPPVPTTSIYSRGDGIVSWRACRHGETSSRVEDVEVHGSHCGMGWNPEVLRVVADRLAQPEDGWKPYEAERSRGGMPALAS